MLQKMKCKYCGDSYDINESNAHNPNGFCSRKHEIENQSYYKEKIANEAKGTDYAGKIANNLKDNKGEKAQKAQKADKADKADKAAGFFDFW